MLKQKVTLVLFFVIFLIFISSSVSAQSYHYCSVVGIGMGPSGSTVSIALDELSNQSWTGARWFIITGNNSKAVLAIALSAQISGSKVTVALASTSQWTSLTALYIWTSQ